MRGGITAYVWLTSLYPSLGWVLGGISGRTGLNLGGGAASYCFSTRPVVRHGWVSIPVVGASASRESSTEDLQRLTVVQLKDRLRELGFMVSGNKVELVERLCKGINSRTGGKGENDNDINDSTAHSCRCRSRRSSDINDRTAHSCRCRSRRSSNAISENAPDTSVELPPPLEGDLGDLDDQNGNINSLVSQEGGECPECVVLLDGEKVVTSTSLASSYPTNRNDELDKEPEISEISEISETKKQQHMEELPPLSRPKPKRRLLTDDDLLPSKRSKRSPSSRFRKL